MQLNEGIHLGSTETNQVLSALYDTPTGNASFSMTLPPTSLNMFNRVLYSIPFHHPSIPFPPKPSTLPPSLFPPARKQAQSPAAERRKDGENEIPPNQHPHLHPHPHTPPLPHPQGGRAGRAGERDSGQLPRPFPFLFWRVSFAALSSGDPGDGRVSCWWRLGETGVTPGCCRGDGQAEAGLVTYAASPPQPSGQPNHSFLIYVPSIVA